MNSNIPTNTRSPYKSSQKGEGCCRGKPPDPKAILAESDLIVLNVIYINLIYVNITSML